jgi:hypothetical protein
VVVVVAVVFLGFLVLIGRTVVVVTGVVVFLTVDVVVVVVGGLGGLGLGFGASCFVYIDGHRSTYRYL